MVHSKPSAPDSGGQVIRFRHRAETATGGSAVQDPAANDLAKYARDDTPDDYRHRMITNAAALAFVALLAAAGLWLADTMASMRKSQDCVLTGRRGCSPVEVPVRSRY